jgi:hypothetical protein
MRGHIRDRGISIVFVLALFALATLVGACGAPPTSVPPTPVPESPTPAPTTGPPTAAPTPLPTTPVPPTATPTPKEESERSTPRQWDFVYFGDSMTWFWPEIYAAHIEADLGVTVTVHNWSRSNRHSTQLLYILQNDEELRDVVGEAEVIAFDIPAKHVRQASYSYDAGTCGGSDGQDCLREGLELYKADVDAILDEILSLRGTDEALIRTMDYYLSGVNQLQEDGTYQVLYPYYRECCDYLAEAASQRSIPVAQVHLAFNGPGGDEDPGDKGLIGNDGIHVGPEGAAVIAGLYRGLGYEFARP